ncbi:MAG: PTS sugar transporter subunit IIA [Bacilli bacterium]
MGLFDKLLKKEEKNHELVAVLSGEILPITECEDPVFAQKIMGDGYLIIPSDNFVLAPCNGVIKTVFPTKHAIGMTSSNGDDIIIHVGLDTVSLNGEGFKALVKDGDKVVAGQKLLEVDFALIKDKVPSIATPVVISNLEDKQIELVKTGLVKAGEVVLNIN